MDHEQRLALRLTLAGMHDMDKFELLDMVWAQLAMKYPEMDQMLNIVEMVAPVILVSTAHERDKRRRQSQQDTC